MPIMISKTINSPTMSASEFSPSPVTVVSDFTLTDFSNVCCHGDSVLDWIPEAAVVGSELDFG